MNKIKLSSLLLGSATILSLIIALWGYYEESNNDARFAMILLFVLVIVFLLFTIIQEYRYSRRARYAEAMNCIHNAYYECLKKIPEEDKEAYIKIEKRSFRICDNIAMAFNLLTHTRCAVCIKIIDQDEEDIKKKNPELKVDTICRDTISYSKRDSKILSKKLNIEHFISKNTDFQEVIENTDHPAFDRCFFENNLTVRKNYKNTSHEIYGESKKLKVNIPILRFFYNDFKWKLPYKSTIVAPICPLRPDSGDIQGFLCVDSTSRNVFVKKYDSDIIINIAASLYPMILRWQNICN